ncbi:capZ-interacting protein isoform X2 [Mixophyes fleayi]|uniref:capZ-interacting protein isoform X2 n=1 Tax=Mixophyes fleayi TaxID=3061075 RepID=UPI003F4DC4F5
MEEKSVESSTAEETAPPSVAKLAGIFGDKANSPRKEVPPVKPTRRKPPCSLPLAKPTVTNNGDEKMSPSQPQMPKIKVKSSPLIEKLQANLAFAPASLLPGVPPKSPGLKVMASPFSSPPSTPNTPGSQSHGSEPEETPVSFEQPPEGAHLQSYTKIRTRGSIKRRPPSRSFRKSQTDMDFDVDLMTKTAKENGDKKAEGDSVLGLRDKQDPCNTESAQATDTASSDSANKSSDSADKSSESQKSDPDKTEKQEDVGETPREGRLEHQAGKPDSDQGEKPDKDDGKLDTNEADTQVTKEEDLTISIEKSGEEPREDEKKDGSGEHSKSDGEDKPEK